jgi:hypothetical protein
LSQGHTTEEKGQVTEEKVQEDNTTINMIKEEVVVEDLREEEETEEMTGETTEEMRERTIERNIIETTKGMKGKMKEEMREETREEIIEEIEGIMTMTMTEEIETMIDGRGRMIIDRGRERTIEIEAEMKDQKATKKELTKKEVTNKKEEKEDQCKKSNKFNLEQAIFHS